ncbi:MAG: hypothetical protein ACJAUG_001413 [Halioglobus sp.]|jgi:hypothetical protein
MAVDNKQSIPQEQFLNIAGNLLHRAFLDSTRTKAKNTFKALAAGKTVPLTNVEMEDKSTVRFDIALDHSEYLGSINFGAFRSSVTVLIASLGENLGKEEQIKVFTEQDNPNAMIFGVTAVTQESDEPNIMVLGANMSADNPSVLLRLLYINHEQFAAAQETA